MNQLKKMVSLLVVASIVFSMNLSHFVTDAFARTITQLHHSTGYLLANAGQTIDLKSIRFEDQDGSVVTGDEFSFSSSGEGIKFEGGKLIVNSSGVHKFTASKDEASIDMILVAKNPEDDQFVLYEQDFNNMADGAFPEGFRQVEGTLPNRVYVENKSLVINSMGESNKIIRVILPEYLSVFGDYVVEADMTMLEAADNARWNSIFVRGQENGSYYHLGVRQKASQANGVEFSLFDSAWTVIHTKGFTEDLSPSKSYRYKVETKGNNVKAYINGKIIYDIDKLEKFEKGNIGFGASDNRTRIDNIRVTLNVDTLKNDLGYILADKDSPVPLSSIEFLTYTGEKITGDKLNWNFEKSDVSIQDGSMIASQTGVFKATAETGVLKTEVVVVVKNPDDVDYVLYQQNFNGLQSGTLPEGFKMLEGSGTKVENNALSMDSTKGTNRVYLPEYLENFGDYTIEFKMQMLDKTDSARWFGTQFRIRNENIPCYHLITRQNARPVSGNILQLYDGSYTTIDQNAFFEDISATKTYRFKIEVKGENLKYLIDDVPVLEGEYLKELKKGGIALVSNGVKVVVDDIKITLGAKHLESKTGYLGVNVNEPLDLSTISLYDYTGKPISGDKLAWLPQSEYVTFKDGKLTASKKGVHKVLAKNGSATERVYIIAKNASETYYTLYEENFDNVADGSLPEGYRRVEGRGACVNEVQNGVLVLDGRPISDSVRVMLPDYLNLFSDYKIEAKVGMPAAANDARWVAVSFRMQDETGIPYYHFAVRQNSESLITRFTGAYTDFLKANNYEKLATGKMYNFVVDVKGSAAVLTIDGRHVLRYSELNEYKKGGIGFGVNNAQMRIDDVKITLNAELLNHETGYILCDAGTEINRTDIKFTDINGAVVTAKDLAVSSQDSAVEVKDNTIYVKEKGRFKLNVRQGEYSRTIYILAKNSSESQYTIYEENFDGLADGTVPQGWTVAKGGNSDNKVEVQNKKFLIDSIVAWQMPYLTLPNEIGDFANFTLEADFQPVSITDNNRWSAIKLRMQEQGYPYYRVAVRYLAKSSGGVFTEYINDVGTAVNKKDYSYIDNIILNKNYKLKLEVYGQKARFFIDDDFVMEMDYLNLLEKGTLGFEVSGMRVFLDNIKVTLKEKPIPEKLGAYIVDVQEPETSISMAPTLMAEIETKDILNSLKGDVKPASALMYLNNKLILTSKAGDREIAPIDDAFEVLGKNIIPVFYVNDTATASALIKFIKRESIIDYSVMSSDANIIKLIRSEYYMARGILDCSNLSELNDGILHDIIQKAVESGSRTLVLPQSLAAKDTVEALQNKLLEVYTKAEPRIDSAMKIHGIINSSVNGIITDSFEKFISAYSKYTGTNSVTRSTKIIGHRGVSSLAPENTIAGFKLAKELGASIIETDLYITKDNHIVAMHDPLIERTTNGSGNIENMTLAELKQFVVNKQFPGKFLDERIPTLQEILDYIRGTDCSIILEIKSEQPRLIDELARVLNQVENKDNIIVGCFDQTKLKAVGGKVPDVKLLWFNGWVAIDTKLEESLRNSLDGVQFYEAGFGPDYTTVGPKFLEASKHRNIQTWVWTINDNQSLNSFMAMGVHGITTDYVQFASEYARRVEPVQGSYTLKNMEAVQLKGKVTAYNGEVKEVIAVPVVLDGEDNVEVNGDYLIAKKPGTSVVMLRYSQPMGDSEYNIYSEPFEITIQTEQYPDPVITSSASGVTNKDVVVKSEKLVRFVVNGNEDLMPSKEKTISTEGVFEVYGKDLAGRESNRVTFTIDKTAPVITGVEDNTVYTRPVNITFTDNSAITAMLNGNVVTSGITVSEEGTYILEITDEAGNKTVCNFFIKNTVPVISSRTVRIDKVNGRITKLEEGTTVTEFKNSFSIQNGTIKVFDSSGKEVTEGNIGTGFKLAVYSGDNVVEEYTVIIYGDINNDGKINSLDLMKVKKHILELETVNGANLTAADVNKDNSLNSLDLMFIKQHTLEKKKIAQ